MTVTGCAPGTLELIEGDTTQPVGRARDAAAATDVGVVAIDARTRWAPDATARRGLDASSGGARLDAGTSSPPPADAGSTRPPADAGSTRPPADAGPAGPGLPDDCGGFGTARHAAIFAVPPDTARGAVEFRVSCGHAACHGEDGESGRAPGLGARVPLKSNCGLITLLLNGDGDMPALSSLPDQEIANIVAYVRSRFR